MKPEFRPVLGGAQAITAPLFGHFIAGPGQKQTLADQTATTAFTALTNAARWALCMIHQKTFNSGTGVNDVIYEVQGATDAAFTTNLVYSERKRARRAAGVEMYFIMFQATTAVKNWRVFVLPDGTDTLSFDAVIVGIP